MGNDNCFSPNVQGLKEKLEMYKSRYNDRKIKSKNYYNNIKESENSVSNYRTSISELNYQFDQYNTQKIINKDENNTLLNDLKEITNKINEYQNVLENQKTLLKNLENNLMLIQKQFDDIDLKFQNKESINNELIEKIFNNLEKLLGENQEILINLEEKKKFIEQNKIEIEIESKLNKILKIAKNDKNILKTEEKGLKDFINNKNELGEIYAPKENENKDNEYEVPLLLMKNWHEICYINNDYDIHDVTYDLKAVGLPPFMNFEASFFFFEPDISINILLFEIDGNKAIYQFEKHCIYFNINLKNLESNKIHIKYKESPEKMTEEEKAFRNIYRSKYYGLSERLVGENAKYILKNESDLEIINFDDEFLIKINDNEYQWEGIVPNEGKLTRVRMSKKEGIVHYLEKQEIKTKNNSLIKNSNLIIPFSYIGGNNEIIKNEYGCSPKGEIKLGKNDRNERIYDIKFQNINSNTAEFHFEGELKNKCNMDWVINLTNEEIESLIPSDFKTNKVLFNKTANNIIKEYDKEHKDDVIKVPDVVKIGKWIKKNIKYDIRYTGMNHLTAFDTLNDKRGVCHHFTKLFNALMYALGYPVLYALGFAMTNKNSFGIEDSFCWSLINLDKKGLKWTPFDATFGIFSGKLPVTHVFKKIGVEGALFLSYDNADMEPPYIQGRID